MAAEAEAAPAPAVVAEAPQLDGALDGEEGPAKPAPAGAPRPAEEAEPYDPSLLIMHKGKAKRPARPDDAERNAQVGKLQEQIDKASLRIKEIKAILDSRGSGGQRVVPPEQQAIRDKIAGLRGEFDAVLLQKKRLQSQNDDKRTEIDKLFAEQRSIKDTVRGPSNLANLDAAIAELEFKLTHESLSAVQEKNTRERKERMERQDRPAVARLAQVVAAIDEHKAASNAIRAQIAELNGQLDKIKAAREAEETKLGALRAAEQEARSDIPALHVEKKELWEVIQALRDKQREIRTAFNAKWDEFKKQDKAWKGWFAEERKKRQEQRHKEWQERQAARQANDMVHKPAKFEMEVFTCEQVLSYLRQFVAAEKKDAAAGADKKEVEAPAPGMKLLSKKDADADSLYAGTGSKKGRGARKAAEKQQKADAVKQLPKILPLETLKTFNKLGLDAPKTNDDVPAAIAAVEAKKAEYEERRDKAALEPEPEEEPEEVPEEPPAEPEAEEKEGEEEEEAEAAKEEGGKAEEVTAKAEEPAANGDAPAPKAEANGDTAPKAEANGDAPAPKAWPAAAAAGAAAAVAVASSPKKAAKADADGLGVKLRVTDDGAVNLEVTV